METLKKSKSSNPKFFIRDENGIFVGYIDFFDTLQSRTEAIDLAIRIIGEIHLTLMQEVDVGKPLFIGNMKVVTGLQRSLDELEKRWPCLLDEVYSVERRIGGCTLGIC